MVYYQSAVKQYGMTLISGILALLLASGCVARNSEKVPEGKVVQSATATRTVQAEEIVQAEEMAPRLVENIFVDKSGGQMTVWIEGSRALEYTSIKQSFPFAVSVYLPETALSQGLEPEVDVSSDSRIGDIKAGYADEEQTTAKVDILLTQNMPYEVVEEGSRLGILLRDTLDAAQIEYRSQLTTAQAADMKSSHEAETLVIPEGPAELTNIEFNTDASGRSDIHIETDHPVRYDTRQNGDNEFQITLYDTKIPVHHQRPLLTRYFNSAVERVEPQAYPGRSEDTLIDIVIREKVPFKVVQNRSGLYLSFEPSSIKPPEFTKAKRTLGSNTVHTVHSAPPQLTSNPTEIKLTEAMHQQKMFGSTGNGVQSYTDPVLGLSNGPYTGEKIKLDFFDTDIKNVFRILRSVSGQNFAIDKNVGGKVTLSLEQAVPWDQVLDLVLKMNGLGKKMEGNVVRIATAATLTKEEKMLQDAIAARKKSIEQQKALEPLVTEYIPINYSDAKTDIEPHIKKLLTPKRGKISVDKRTNMIILTDTRKKIDEANDLIYRLDKVTPQIMIEAKVVEVTKEFKRSLGVSWNLSNASSITSGFVDDFSVAVNNGSNIGVSGDFSFFRLLGSSAALNAQLDASEERGDVKIVSSPRIMTLDNKKAMIKQGEEYAYTKQDESGNTNVEFKDIDLLLEVTPHVTPDKRISMTVKLTKNDVASLTSDGVPITNTNEAETELLVNNRDTIVIGGVVKSRLQKDDDGIPFLSGIPILGYLFSNKYREDTRDELLIFLTPSIVQLEQKRHTSSDASASYMN